MKYLSVCSGIEAATIAWHDLGMEPIGFSEIEPFPCTVLAHHYPSVPNFGDMTKYREWPIGTDNAFDVLVGGTPCQSFSVAGLRAGLDDPRGNLALVYCGLLDRFRPRWFVWENVPGVLSSNGGRDFGAFLGAVAKLGYGFTYRVLDAQYFGVAQRRRRVFVVGHLGDWRPAAAVLFERESLRGDTAPSRKKGQGFTADVAPCIGASGRGFDRTGETRGQDPVVAEVAHALTKRHDSSEDGTGRETPLVAIGVDVYNHAETGDVAATLGANSGECNTAGPKVMANMAVRRLTPIECERLQGFPDGYTAIPWKKKPAEECPDGPRYKALGNSMAVPIMRWIGESICRFHA